MSSAANTYDLPKTQQGAPPSFYNQAGRMAAQQVQGGQQNGQSQQPATNQDTQKYIEMTSKLLTVLQSMEAMKPNGVDVSKFMQAAATAAKSALQEVQKGESAAPGTEPAAADTGTMPGDSSGGTQGGAAAGPVA